MKPTKGSWLSINSQQPKYLIYFRAENRTKLIVTKMSNQTKRQVPGA